MRERETRERKDWLLVIRKVEEEKEVEEESRQASFRILHLPW